MNNTEKVIADLEFVVRTKDHNQVRLNFDTLVSKLREKYVLTLKDSYGRIVPEELKFRVTMTFEEAE